MASFITKLLQVKGATRVLDPLGGNGLLGAYIAETLPLERVDILSIDEDSEVLLRPLNLSNLSLHLIERIRGAESHLADQYDAIVSLPPIGTKATELTIESSVEPIELNDCTSLLVMAYMESRLSQSGPPQPQAARASSFCPSRAKGRNFSGDQLHPLLGNYRA